MFAWFALSGTAGDRTRIDCAFGDDDVKVAVVIPCYKARDHILTVLRGIPEEVSRIYVVDDCCPEHSGDHVERNVADERLCVIRNPVNTGVGGAVKAGYVAALHDGMDVLVKLDGDGQMDPRLIPALVRPIRRLDADYVKGNRFHSLYSASKMPWIRLVGNAALSFVTKASSGYWSVFDPTNGFTAISRSAATRLDFDRIANRYFFETDMLIHLGGIRAVVREMPMEAKYGDEVSHLKISSALPEFFYNNLRSICRRILYMYFLRDFSLASLQFLIGVPLLGFGVAFGGAKWFESFQSGVVASGGTVMLSALSIILGIQFIMGFLAFDIGNEPKAPLMRLDRS